MVAGSYGQAMLSVVRNCLNTLTALALTSGVMLDRSGEVRHPCLVAKDLSRKASHL